MFNDLSRLGKYLGQAARLMVGMPDYDNYVEHMQTKHPDKPVMSYEMFFRERQEAAEDRDGDGRGHAESPDFKKLNTTLNKCGSEPARESGVSVNIRVE